MLRDPWFWAFLAILGWFVGLLVVGSSTFGTRPVFGVISSVFGHLPRAILPLPFVHQPRIAEGDFSIALGVLILLAVAPFTLAGLKVAPWTRPHAREPLRTEGLYGVVRHPLYFRAAFWPLGWSLIFGSWIGVGLTPAWLAICWAFAAFEDEQLVAVYGEAYRRYQARTPRLIPFAKLRRAADQARRPASGERAAPEVIRAKAESA